MACRITVPLPVQAATARHRFEMDSLAPFLSEECVRDSGGVADRGGLYGRCGVFCEETGDEHLSKRAFAIAQGAGDHSQRANDRRTWRGIRIRTPAEYCDAVDDGGSRHGSPSANRSA